MPRRSSPSQIDLFPQRVDVRALDPRIVVGGDTRVKAVFTVKYEREPSAHQVFHDRHGWYCAEHGKACPAVREVTARGARASVK